MHIWDVYCKNIERFYECLLNFSLVQWSIAKERKYCRARRNSMLKNALTLTIRRIDEAANELSKVSMKWTLPNKGCTRHVRSTCNLPWENRAGTLAQERMKAPRSSPRPSLFPRLVLSWINADFRVQIRIFQHFSSSTRKSSSRKQICKIRQNFTEFLKKIDTFLEIFRKKCKILKNLQKFCRIFTEFFKIL